MYVLVFFFGLAVKGHLKAAAPCVERAQSSDLLAADAAAERCSARQVGSRRQEEPALEVSVDRHVHHRQGSHPAREQQP